MMNLLIKEDMGMIRLEATAARQENLRMGVAERI